MQQDTTGGVLINFHELSAVAYIHVTCSSLCQILLKFVSLIMSVYYKGRLVKCTYTYVCHADVEAVFDVSYCD